MATLTDEETAKARDFLGLTDPAAPVDFDQVLAAATAARDQFYEADETAGKAATSLSRVQGELAAEKAAREAAEQKAKDAEQAVSLSRTPKPLDPDMEYLMTTVLREKEAAVIASGAMSEAEVQALRPMFFDGEKPNGVALSRQAGSREPHYLRLLDTRMKFHGQGIATSGGVNLSRGEPAALPTGEKNPQTDKPSAERMAELREQAGVTAA